MLYHVLGETKTSSMITGWILFIPESGPGTHCFHVHRNRHGVSINGAANVTAADIRASNGVIHAIDAVILPPTVVDLAVQNGNFQTLVSAVVGAGLAETLV